MAVEHLRGQLATWSGHPLASARRLASQAKRKVESDPVLSMRLALDAAVASVFAGRIDDATNSANLVAEIACRVPAAEPISDLLNGALQAVSGGGTEALILLDRCRELLDTDELTLEGAHLLTYLATAYCYIDEFDPAKFLIDRVVLLARHEGIVSLLPFALGQQSLINFRTGNWDAAGSIAAEGLFLADETARATDHANVSIALALLAAARADPDAREIIENATREAHAIGAGFLEAQSYSILGFLELGSGDPAAASATLRKCQQLATDFGLLELGHLQWAAELVEALVHCGDLPGARAAVEFMVTCTHPNSTTLNRALLARCRGLVSGDVESIQQFQEAIVIHEDCATRPFELARTRLCFGERLRRLRRRREAREQLGAAWNIFSDLGARAWAQRAIQEFEATGATAPAPVMNKARLLTPQEFQVASAVANGASNREAANALFLSQKTVEFHLTSIYRRLGISSRADLVNALSTGPPSAI